MTAYRCSACHVLRDDDREPVSASDDSGRVLCPECATPRSSFRYGVAICSCCEQERHVHRLLVTLLDDEGRADWNFFCRDCHAQHPPLADGRRWEGLP